MVVVVEVSVVMVVVEVSVVMVVVGNCPGLQSQFSSNTAPVWTVLHTTTTTTTTLHHHSTVKVGLSVKN